MANQPQAIESRIAYKWVKALPEWDHSNFRAHLNSPYAIRKETSFILLFDVLREMVRANSQNTSRETLHLKYRSAAIAYNLANSQNDQVVTVIQEKKLSSLLNNMVSEIKRFIALQEFSDQIGRKEKKSQGSNNSVTKRPQYLRRFYFLKGLKNRSRHNPLPFHEYYWQAYLKEYQLLARDLAKEKQYDLLHQLEHEHSLLATNAQMRDDDFQSYTYSRVRALDRYFYQNRLREACILINNFRAHQDKSAEMKLLLAVVKEMDALRQILHSVPAIHERDEKEVIDSDDFWEHLYEVYRSGLVIDKSWKQVQLKPDLQHLTENQSKLRHMIEGLQKVEGDPYPLGLLSNLLVGAVNRGMVQYEVALFTIYADRIDAQSLLDEFGLIPAISFRNTIHLGFRLGQEYRTRSRTLLKLMKRGKLKPGLSLNPKSLPAFKNLCFAWEDFFDGNYQSGLQRIQHYTLEDHYHQINLLGLKFKLQFHLDVIHRPNGNNWPSEYVLAEYVKYWAQTDAISARNRKVIETLLTLLHDLVRLKKTQMPPLVGLGGIDEFFEKVKAAAISSFERDWLNSWRNSF